MARLAQGLPANLCCECLNYSALHSSQSAQTASGSLCCKPLTKASVHQFWVKPRPHLPLYPISDEGLGWALTKRLCQGDWYRESPSQHALKNE